MATVQDLKKLKRELYGNPNWIDGRVNRLEYFIRCFLLVLAFGFLMTFGLGFLIAGYLTSSILSFAIGGALVALAVWAYWRIEMATVKRLHDLGWSGWWALVFIFWGIQPVTNKVAAISPTIVMVVSLFLFVFGLFLIFARGDKGPNKYGKDPLMKYEDNK